MKGYEIAIHDTEIQATRENDQAQLREDVGFKCESCAAYTKRLNMHERICDAKVVGHICECLQICNVDHNRFRICQRTKETHRAQDLVIDRCAQRMALMQTSED